MIYLWIALSGIVGLALGVIAMQMVSRAGLNKDQQKAEQILRKAETDADAKVKQAVLDGKTQVHEMKVEAEKRLKNARQKLPVRKLSCFGGKILSISVMNL